jgi:hypothetical protein
MKSKIKNFKLFKKISINCMCFIGAPFIYIDVEKILSEEETKEEIKITKENKEPIIAIPLCK